MRSLARVGARFVGAALLVTAVGLRALPSAEAAGAAPPVIAAGDQIPPFEAESVDGKTVKIDFPKGSKTVLVFFSSTCPVCHRMIPEWNRAYKERKGLTMYAIAMDKPDPAFFIMTPLEFPVLISPGKAFQESIKVQRVPTTLRLGPGGKVEDAAQGQIDRMRLGQFFKP
jgi:thiol-disulfide isomerase/thioredoxin